MKKGGLLLLRANVLVFVILKGVLIVGFSMDKELRTAAREHFGFDILYIGIAGILLGCFIMAKIKEYETTGEIRLWK